ncbi:PIG-L family deacetylase [Candidatus Poribacteria bacterium]|nr:PIG-L family deacetylase [Candidatus Poribacteria bacterium]MBT7101101.1 PIG-L family deacetylase [Candidatus Poribacteria bacterium]MBT7807550.1 PIG-L family deacetylase [Candidatus Poribacteria bacterium]
MSSDPLGIMVFGAHPDDCDIKAGGVAIMWAALGHRVKFVSVTNGDAGHQDEGGASLARRRAFEARSAGEIAGIEYITLDNHDGELEPTLDIRKDIIRLIREFDPDLILTHRPNDYHPDHRYTSILVQDSAYMVTVPNVCADVPHMRRNPVIAYLSDGFRKPLPFTPTVVVDIGSVHERKLDMLHCHTSQVYEWLPYNGGYLDDVPEGETARRAWLGERWGRRSEGDRWRDKLMALYGAERGAAVAYAEAFEGCEYGSSLTDDNLHALFPFIP